MEMPGRVERYLLQRIAQAGSIHVTLVDPEKLSPEQASRVAESAFQCGTSAIMVGGSTFVSQSHLDTVVKAIKRTVRLPVILFPNNVTGISRFADAIWFMSLLNSVDPYFLVGAQILGAPLVKRYRLEPISLGYIVVGEGGTVGIIGKALPIPYTKPELAAVHALAGQYLGMHFIYLEAGSGAKESVPSEMIQAVKSIIKIPLIVGGGIRTREQACTAASSGADIIVTGNVIENQDAKHRVSEVIEGIRSAKNIQLSKR
jgi:phosphoglycerol geranylgeranyltransferase